MKAQHVSLNPSIQDALARAEMAQAQLRKVVAEEQARCAHPYVLEAHDGAGAEMTRMCLECRLEEQVRRKSDLERLITDFVHRVSIDHLRRLRIPGPLVRSGCRGRAEAA